MEGSRGPAHHTCTPGPPYIMDGPLKHLYPGPLDPLDPINIYKYCKEKNSF